VIEYFLWQQFDGMRQLGTIFGPLFRARIPWWYCEYAKRREPGEPLYLLPRDPVWLRFELPRHIERGHRIAKAILRDPFDADEAVARALIRTEAVPYVPENFGAYFDRAVRNAAIDIGRHRTCQPPTVSIDDLCTHFDLYYEGADPEEEAVAAETAAVLRDAVAQLTPVEQEVIKLHYFEGLSIRETAEALGETVIINQTILARARRKLFRILAPKLLTGEWGSEACPPRRARACA